MILLYTALIGVVGVAGWGVAWKISGILLATLALLLICLKKGEPTRWRWGGDDQVPR